MRRAPVSIVILAWNAWPETRACLESLRPTLGIGDEVIVVDNGSTDGTGARLREYPWLSILSNEENRGFAGGCNQGAAAAAHDIIVFLNNDTVLTGKWLDALVAPLLDDAVGAVGPRSNFVSGPQFVRVSYENDDRRAMRRFARTWASEHSGQTSEIRRLVGFCLAIRRSAFEGVGGFDEGYEIGGFEDDDICKRLADQRWRLVVAHESFVHHVGHRTFDANAVDWIAQEQHNRRRFEQKFGALTTRGLPLLSACVLARDATEGISSCLSSLESVVDEIVCSVLDNDEPARATAREHGVTLVEIAAHDDGARARVELASHCRGEWVLVLEPDEILSCESPAGLRNLLQRLPSAVEALEVSVEDGGDERIGPAIAPSRRLYRRGAVTWRGRVCEELVNRHHGLSPFTIPISGVSLQRRVVAPRAGGRARCVALVGRARALARLGELEDALVVARTVVATTTEKAIERQALHVAVACLARLHRTDEANARLRELRSLCHTTNTGRLLEATIASEDGAHDRVLFVLQPAHADEVDDDGFVLARHEIALRRATALMTLGRPSDAADELLALVGEHGLAPAVLTMLLDSLERSSRPVSELLGALRVEQVPTLLSQIQLLPEGVAGQLLDGCYDVFALERSAILASASTLARRLSVAAALLWSGRLREHAMAHACPLVALSSDTARSPRERAQAAAAGYASFGEQRLAAAFPVAFALASPEEQAAILLDTEQVCPELLRGVRFGDTASRHRPDAAAAAVADVAAVNGNPSPAARPGTTTQPRVTIVIPCWNKAEYTLRCLSSLQQHTAPGSYRVVLVDNGSRDATARLSSAKDGSFLVVRNDDNLGFARACNQGAAATPSDVLIFLNNDTEALPGWLPPMVEEFRSAPQVGIVGSRLLYPDGTLQHGGVVLVESELDGLLDGRHRFARAPGTHPAIVRRERLRAVTGAVLGVRTALFEQLAGFDEAYWNGNEDVDLCLRAGELGWQVVYQPMSCLIHHESVSGSERFSQVAQNRLRLSKAWSDKLQLDRAHAIEGVNVVGRFSDNALDGTMCRGLLRALDARGIPVVTTELSPSSTWSEAASPVAHRLGPVQPVTVLVLPLSEPPVDLARSPEWNVERRIALAPSDESKELCRDLVASSDAVWDWRDDLDAFVESELGRGLPATVDVRSGRVVAGASKRSTLVAL